MGFPRILNLGELDTYDTYSATATRPQLGQKMVIEDGRTFRLVGAGGTALINANCTQSIAPSGNFKDEAVGTVAAGETVITDVDSTGGNAAIDLLVNGYFNILTAANLGPVYRIKSNTLITASGNSGTITLYHPLAIAIAVGDKCSYVESPFNDVIIAATTPSAPIVGVVVIAVTANEYGWVATGGPTRVFQDTNSVPVVANGTMVSDAVAGAVEDWLPETDVATGVMSQPVGICMAAQTSAEKCIVFVRLE